MLHSAISWLNKRQNKFPFLDFSNLLKGIQSNGHKLRNEKGSKDNSLIVHLINYKRAIRITDPFINQSEKNSINSLKPPTLSYCIFLYNSYRWLNGLTNMVGVINVSFIYVFIIS